MNVSIAAGYLTKMPKIHNREKITFPTNGAEKSGFPHVEE